MKKDKVNNYPLLVVATFMKAQNKILFNLIEPIIFSFFFFFFNKINLFYKHVLKINNLKCI